MDAKKIDPRTVRDAVDAARRYCFITATLANAQRALLDALGDIGVHPQDGQALADVAYQAASFESAHLAGNGTPESGDAMGKR